MDEITGWLLDLYDSKEEGVVLWVLADDGRRMRLQQPFPVTFYASGPSPRLRAFWQYLETKDAHVRLSRTEGRDLFSPQPVTLLAVEVNRSIEQPTLFRQAINDFPDLTYYDADIPLALRHAAQFGTFPLARCHIKADDQGHLLSLDVLDSPWDLDPAMPPLSVLSLEPDCDPHKAPPASLVASIGRQTSRLPLQPARPLLANLAALLRRHDPDVLLTGWGDTWLIPYLLEMAQRWHMPLPLNREHGRGIARKAERTYFSYGQIIFRGQQLHLFGRWHIDHCNATLWGDYGLEGMLEAARVTGLPVQVSARTSPGTGISSMQIITALRQRILVPWHKQQVEQTKTALDLLNSDQGGLVYQPLVGLHRDVAEIDFISMYPGIMVHHNISPETIRPGSLNPLPGPPGLIPLTLGPLLEKRVALKHRLLKRPAWHPANRQDKARSSAEKWLLVTCFGYLGYKNARFGRIEAHEAVTSRSREALITAKEAAEDMGYTVIQMYVDALWVARPGASRPEQVQPLLDEIAARTGLPISLDGIMRWVAFLPSRRDSRIPVANRYFGVFQDGTIKVRGIEARRRDTAPFIARVQMEMLECLAQAEDASRLADYVPGAVGLLRKRLFELRAGRVPFDQLLVSQKLSRKLEDYVTLSPAARAAAQLATVGKKVSPGERVRFLYTRGEPGVHAWDLPGSPITATLDVPRYRELLLRAAHSILQPLGMDEIRLNSLARGEPLAMPLMAGWLERVV
jgi:DNA polymerase II